jgi:hypothetical protein
MIARARIRWVTWGLLSASTLLTGCAVALGPGFHFDSRTAEISPVSSGPIHVHVQLTDELANMGNSPLKYLDVAPPVTVEAKNLRVHANGPEAQPTPLGSGPDAVVRLRFEPPWPQQQMRSFAFDYDVDPDGTSDLIAAAPDAFHWADPNAFPRWLPPQGVFVRADSAARKEEFSVTLPAGFRVIAAGRERSRRKQGDLILRRYRLARGESSLFAVAGRYQETPVHTGHGDVIFWTLHALDASSAAKAAERLAATVAMYQQLFGPASTRRTPIRIVEMPAAPAAVKGDEFRAVAFPYGALLEERAFAKGVDDEATLEAAESTLAQTWFGWLARPSLKDRALLGSGAGLFAMVMAAEARGGAAARNQAIERLLSAYDKGQPLPAGNREAKQTAGETPLDRAYKAALFWCALEDASGKEPLQRAARHLLQALAGTETSEGDLLSALEEETGRDMNGIFHAWLDRPGIPAEFRARYAPAP